MSDANSTAGVIRSTARETLAAATHGGRSLRRPMCRMQCMHHDSMLHECTCMAVYSSATASLTVLSSLDRCGCCRRSSAESAESPAGGYAPAVGSPSTAASQQTPAALQRGPYQLVEVYYKHGRYELKTIETEADLRAYILEAIGPNIKKAVMLAEIGALPLDELSALYIRLGAAVIDGENGYGCVSITEGPTRAPLPRERQERIDKFMDHINGEEGEEEEDQDEEEKLQMEDEGGNREDEESENGEEE
jgi:hypothetical protein